MAAYVVACVLYGKEYTLYMIRYQDAASIAENILLPKIAELYGLKACGISQIGTHEGGRNLVYRASGKDEKIIRISFLPNRRAEDYCAETAYVRYLQEHGASVANVIASQKGNLVEVLEHDRHPFYVSLFELAKGDSLAEHQYRYREGAPLSEYFYNCGNTLGQMHQLSKRYRPEYHRYDFFDKYNKAYFDELIPDAFPLLKEKLTGLLTQLKELDRHGEYYGMVHFDYSDGNYVIDYGTGKITVFDFDNCCTCFYMFDLANLWTHGVGWIQFEPDAAKRKAFMDDYFRFVVEGYRSETQLDDTMLKKLPLFIQTVLMENIMDVFEVQRFSGEMPESDEELTYSINCVEADIPYMGFFHEMYHYEAPFEME